MITSAALLLIIVVGSFSTSSVTIIKLIGVAMIVALILDATLVQVLLVPATMRLLGPASWWAPGHCASSTPGTASTKTTAQRQPQSTEPAHEPVST